MLSDLCMDLIKAHVYVERRLSAQMSPFKFIFDYFSSGNVREAAQTDREGTSDRETCVPDHPVCTFNSQS